jgi:hypothetical protein
MADATASLEFACRSVTAPIFCVNLQLTACKRQLTAGIFNKQVASDKNQLDRSKYQLESSINSV